MSAKTLNFGGGVSFGRKKARKPAGMDGMTESEKRGAEAYRARAKAERKRFVAATDSEFCDGMKPSASAPTMRSSRPPISSTRSMDSARHRASRSAAA